MAVRAQHLSAEQLGELYPDVVRVASRIVGRDAAEDVAQETFLRLMALSKPRRPRAWLAKVARNLAIDEVRRRRRIAPVDTPDKATDEPDVAELLSVRRAMQDVPERYRLVLWLKHVEGRSAAEIARMTGVTQSSVEMSLFRARRSLADSYTKQAGFLSSFLAFCAGLRRVFVRGTAAKVTVALAVGALGVAALAPPRAGETAHAASLPRRALAVPRAVAAPAPMSAPSAPTARTTLASLTASVPNAPMSLDQVIANARTIVVGVVYAAAWQRARTVYDVHVEDVWQGSAQDRARFALDGRPFIGPGNRVVAFLGSADHAVRVRRDGELFDSGGRRLGMTYSQLEYRIRWMRQGNGSQRERHQERDSEAPPPWDAWIALLVR